MWCLHLVLVSTMKLDTGKPKHGKTKQQTCQLNRKTIIKMTSTFTGINNNNKQIKEISIRQTQRQTHRQTLTGVNARIRDAWRASHTTMFFLRMRHVGTYQCLRDRRANAVLLRQSAYKHTHTYEGRSKSSRPDLVLIRIKIKIVFASYSSNAQNMTGTIWLLGYKYFVHFNVRTKCLLDGCPDANARTVHKFLKNFSNDTDVTQQKFISQLIIQDETFIHNFDSESQQQSMQWKERIGQNCHFITLCNYIFFHFDRR